MWFCAGYPARQLLPDNHPLLGAAAWTKVQYLSPSPVVGTIFGGSMKSRQHSDAAVLATCHSLKPARQYGLPDSIVDSIRGTVRLLNAAN